MALRGREAVDNILEKLLEFPFPAAHKRRQDLDLTP